MKVSKNNSSNSIKLMKVITFPVRALSKARDFYVKSMNSYADLGCYGGGGGLGFSAVEPHHLNFGSNSRRSSADSDDLIRAVSFKAVYAEKSDLGAVNRNSRLPDFQIPTHPIETSASARVRRNASVGMAKIDEEQAC